MHRADANLRALVFSHLRDKTRPVVRPSWVPLYGDTRRQFLSRDRGEMLSGSRDFIRLKMERYADFIRIVGELLVKRNWPVIAAYAPPIGRRAPRRRSAAKPSSGSSGC